MTFQERPTQRIDWETPKWLFDALDREFGFQLDVCAEPHNTKCVRFFGLLEDGLRQRWSGMCWMNPPYGKDVGKWIKKAYDSACEGDATVVCLIPVRSDNSWWQYIVQSELRFMRGRVTFVGADTGAMFPCAVAIFHAHLDPGGVMSVWNPKHDSQTSLVGTMKNGYG